MKKTYILHVIFNSDFETIFEEYQNLVIFKKKNQFLETSVYETEFKKKN